MSEPQLPEEVAAHYRDHSPERDRLSSPRFRLEMARTQEVISKHLPGGSLRILDVGGAIGTYSAWLASDGVTRQRDVGHFVRWASAEKVTRLELPAVRWRGPTGAIDGEKRREQARWLLADGAVDPSDRVAGLLVLLYAQRASAISRLTLDHVTHDDEGVRLRLGPRPLAVPEPLSTILLDLVANRRGHAAIGDHGRSPWLFPGGQPGRPISASRLTERLRARGIYAGPSHSSALLQLATELPAAVIARLLGVHIKVAVEWQKISSGDWTGYAAGYSRRELGGG